MGDIERPDSATAVPRSEREEPEEGTPEVGEVKEEVTQKEVPLDEPTEVSQDIEIVLGNEKLVIIRQLAALNSQNQTIIAALHEIVELLKKE